MTEQERVQKTNRKPGTRFIHFTKFENETNGESESNDLGSMKNFPLGFIPMTELEESALDR